MAMAAGSDGLMLLAGYTTGSFGRTRSTVSYEMAAVMMQTQSASSVRTPSRDCSASSRVPIIVWVLLGGAVLGLIAVAKCVWKRKRISTAPVEDEIDPSEADISMFSRARTRPGWPTVLPIRPLHGRERALVLPADTRDMSHNHLPQ